MLDVSVPLQPKFDRVSFKCLVVVVLFSLSSSSFSPLLLSLLFLISTMQIEEFLNAACKPTTIAYVARIAVYVSVAVRQGRYLLKLMQHDCPQVSHLAAVGIIPCKESENVDGRSHACPHSHTHTYRIQRG